MVGACVVDQPAARLTRPRTKDAQGSFFPFKSQFLAWADKFLGIWGIFGQFICTHFGSVNSLSS